MKVLVRAVQECRKLVLGGGAIGMLSALLLKAYGCRDVTVAEVNPLRREQLAKHAGVATCNPKDSQPRDNSFDYVIDMRRLTLAEITLLGTCTCTTADLRATVAAIYGGAFGDLAWLDTRALADGAQAFADLDQGHVASAKVILCP